MFLYVPIGSRLLVCFFALWQTFEHCVMQILRRLQKRFRRQTKTVNTFWSIRSTVTPFPSSQSNFFYGKDWDFYLALFFIVIPIYGVTIASWVHVIYSFALDPAITVFSAPRRLLLGWSILECVFSVYHLSIQRTYQSLISYPRVPLDRLRSLYSDCLEQLTDFEEQLPLWFFDAPVSTILRGNVKEWLCWAMFYKHADDICDGSEEDLFLDEMLGLLEARSGHLFKPGWNRAVKCCRLNLDPVNSVHRPLAFYAVCSFVVNSRYGGWMISPFKTHHFAFALCLRPFNCSIFQWIYCFETMVSKDILVVHCHIGYSLATLAPETTDRFCSFMVSEWVCNCHGNCDH